jgi:hypothetical protein
MLSGSARRHVRSLQLAERTAGHVCTVTRFRCCDGIDADDAAGDCGPVGRFTGSEIANGHPARVATVHTDADFFVHRLPGVLDRNGVPVVISQWPDWATQRDDGPEARRVGVISGPTGCGKSSLVRAGILPALPTTCQSVLIEATGEQSELQLQEAISRRCAEQLIGTLSEQLAAIRTASELKNGNSLLIIIDQFEL